MTLPNKRYRARVRCWFRRYGHHWGKGRTLLEGPYYCKNILEARANR